MVGVRLRSLLALLGLALALAAQPALAQEQFFTQSGGHGIENAKTNARLTKTEKDVDALNAQVAKVKQHAYADIPSCADSGSKLRWNNGAWSCDNETDPTVQSWAKSPLPSCGAHQMLSASGSGFGCTSADFVSNETDPTVQAWAKSPLPSCGSGEVLTASGGAFTCKVDDKGLLQETDPFVYPFARTDQATINDCNVGQKLTMTGARLVCSPDAVGVTSETDPFIQSFARNDISSSIVTACGTGKVLTAVGTSGTTGVVLTCVADQGGVSDPLNLGQLGDVNTIGETSGTVLIYNGSKWVPGSARDSSVQDYARIAITACGTGQLVVYDGTKLKCTDSANVVSISTNLSQLGDVNVSGTVNHNILTFNGIKWVNLSTIDGVVIGGSTPASATFTQLTATGIGAGSIRASGVITAPTMLTSASTVQGNQNVTGDLHVGGTLYVSGGQSIDGVLFANGGVSASGTISATHFTGDGSGLTGVEASGVDWYSISRTPVVLQNISNSTGSVTVTSIDVSNANIDNDLHVHGNLYVSGSQSFDGVTFANGGVSATGSVTATSFHGDGSGLTGVAASSVSWSNVNGVPVVLQNISNSTGSVTVTSVNATTGSFNTIGAGNINASGTISSAALTTSNALVQGDLRVTGNFYVSGSQSIDGVTFANGGVSATGTISATRFSGDASGMTGLVQDRIVSGTTSILASNNASVTITIAGSPAVTVGTNGYVGIGTTSPSYPLQFGSRGSSGNLVWSGTDDALTGNTFFGIYDAFNDLYYGISRQLPSVSGTSSMGGYYKGLGIGGASTGLGNPIFGVLNSTENLNGPKKTALTVYDNNKITTFNNMLDDGTGRVGIGMVTPTVALEVSGTISATNLRLSGNLYVSGSQSIDGVVFANGGISATGVVSATHFYGDGSTLSNLNPNVSAGVSGSLIFRDAAGALTASSSLYYDMPTSSVLFGGSFKATNFQAGDNAGYNWGNWSSNIIGNSTSKFIAFSTSSTEAMRIVSNGAIGIGTSNPGGANAQVAINTVPATMTALSIAAPNAGGASVFAVTGPASPDTNSGKAFSFSIVGESGARGVFYTDGSYGIGSGATATRDLFLSRLTTSTLVITSDRGNGAAGLRVTSWTTINSKVTPTAPLDVYGTVSATHFIGDGSGLTGVTAGATDRIVSGTTSMIAISNTGFISLTQAGTNTGWFDPTRGLVTIGVSSTGVISATSFAAPLGTSTNVAYGIGGASTGLYATGTGDMRLAVNGSSILRTAGLYTYTANRMMVGNLNSNPSQTLHVNGTFLTTSWTGINFSNPANVTPTAPLEVSGTVSATQFVGQFVGDGSGLTGVTAAGSDRITSGTTQMVVISTTGFISLTQAGTNTGWFDPTRGLVTIGVSSTGPISGTTGYFANPVTIGGPLTAGYMLTITSNSTTPALIRFTNGTSTGYLGANGNGLFYGATTATGLSFLTNNTQRLQIGASGLVGIGLSGTVATTALEVSGTISTTAITISSTGVALQITNSIVNNIMLSGMANGRTMFFNADTAEIGFSSSLGNGSRTGHINRSTNSNLLVNSGGGLMGVALPVNTQPSATLHVSGTFLTTSWTGINFSNPANVTPTAPLEVSGTISATHFVGDGSGLTGLAAAFVADRIVSGTTSLLAVSASGFISLTQAGTNTGWFDPTSGLVTIGVSSTGPISGTSGYFSGRVGINGAPFAGYSLSVTGAVIATSNYWANNNNGLIWGGVSNSIIGDSTAATQNMHFSVAAAEAMRIVSSGFVGIGTTQPSGTLHLFSPHVQSLGTYSLVFGNGDSSTMWGWRVDGNNNFILNGGTPGSWVSASPLTIKNAGAAPLVGIGLLTATNPSATIHVSGTAIISSWTTIGSNNLATDLLEIDGGTGANGITVSTTGAPLITLKRGSALAKIALASAGNFVSFAKNNDMVVQANSGNLDLTASGAVILANGSSPVLYVTNTLVGIGTASPTTQLEVSGTISATHFVGDGSGLTGLASAFVADRIVSGTTSLLAVSSTGFISLTQAGTNTGWFDPTRGLVTIGVSSTGVISATSMYLYGTSGIYLDASGASSYHLYNTGGTLNLDTPGNGNAMSIGGNNLFWRASSGNVGIGVLSNPSATLHVSGSLMVTNGSVSAPTLYVSSTGGFVALGSIGVVNNSMLSITSSTTGSIAPQIGFNNGTTRGYIGVGGTAFTFGTTSTHQLSFITNNTARATILSNGNFGIGILNPSVALEVSGTVSATHFVGDGSGLTGLASAFVADRIVSGTTSLLAVSSTGFISLTQAGTNTGWFDPTRGLVTLGVSTTGTISGTSGYFSGGVGIGTNAPTALLDVGGLLAAPNGAITTPIAAFSGNIAGISGIQMGNTSTATNAEFRFLITDTTSNYTAFTMPSTGNTSSPIFGLARNTGTFIFNNGGTSRNMGIGTLGSNDLVLGTSNVDRLHITSDGKIGIGSATPSVALEVSGTVSATHFVGDGSGLTNITAGATDRIVSGTTRMIAISTTGFISLTQAGTNTGWFDPTRGLVTIGVSSTGTISATNGWFTGYVVVGNGQALSIDGGQSPNLWNRAGYVTMSNFTGGAGFDFTDVNGGSSWVRIISTGLVGIGTTAPKAMLDVSGTIKMSGTGSETCGATTYGTMRYTASGMQLCRP